MDFFLLFFPLLVLFCWSAVQAFCGGDLAALLLAIGNGFSEMLIDTLRSALETFVPSGCCSSRFSAVAG